MTATMRLNPSDYQVLQVVDKFTMLTTTQIASLCFPSARSHTSHYRVIQRLISRDLLEPVLASHTSMRVYQLGAAGWRVMRSGRRVARMQVDNHALLLADVYIAFQSLPVVELVIEPDSWQEIAGLLLKPDIDVIWRRSDDKRSRAFIEADTGTEHLKRLKDKLDSYTYACNASKDSYFPLVLFVCTTQARVDYLRDVVKRGGYDSTLFQAVLLDELPAYIQRF